MLIVSYDITDDKRRAEFAKFLKKYGPRMQYSVFTVRNSPRVQRNILSEIEGKFKKKFKKTDSIVLFPICEGCRSRLIRYGCAKHDSEDVVYFG